MKRRQAIAGFIFEFVFLPLNGIWKNSLAVAYGIDDLGRSLQKSKSKRISRVNRRRNNERAATLDDALQNSNRETTKQNQLGSPLLRLPLELRQQIYDLCLPPITVMIRELDMDGYKLVGTEEIPSSNRFHRGFSARRPGVRIRLLYLPLVCRQIYVESIDHLFKRTTFVFVDHKLPLLLPSLCIFPATRMEAIRSLELKFYIDVLVRELKFGKSQAKPYYECAIESRTGMSTIWTRRRREWLALWKFLATLPRLERLVIEFARLPGPGEFLDAAFWCILAPLMHFERQESLAVFEVQWLDKYECTKPSEGWLKAMPFDMKRKQM